MTNTSAFKGVNPEIMNKSIYSMFSSQFAKLNVQNRPFPSSSKDALVILQDCDIYNMPSLINYCRTAAEIESLSANVLKAKEKEEASRMRATKKLEDFGRVMNDQHEAETAAIAAKMDEMALPQKSEKGPEAPRAKIQKVSEEDTDFGDRRQGYGGSGFH